MNIYPAIDILNGKCVRLTQGKFEEESIYSDDPVGIAKRWKEEGANYLHIVDLDGAKDGKSENEKMIAKITSEISLPIQIGGGIRSLDTIAKWMDIGVSRVILGSVAIENTSLVKEAVKLWGNRIAIGIDAKEGYVAIHGWKIISEKKAFEFAKAMESLGVETIVYTDISRDGTLQGPNLTAMREMANFVNVKVIASGGVGTIQDIAELAKTGVDGVIVGKALYTGDIKLKDAIKSTEGM